MSIFTRPDSPAEGDFEARPGGLLTQSLSGDSDTYIHESSSAFAVSPSPGLSVTRAQHRHALRMHLPLRSSRPTG